jgi:CRP/FNR family transcriptional regulator, cyclic AMP receptor protein
MRRACDADLGSGCTLPYAHHVAHDRLLELLTGEERKALLSVARRRRFDHAEVIFHEGDPGDSLYVIVEGHVLVRVTTPAGDVATFGVLGPGDYFGELALLSDDATRTATVAAIEPVETLSLRRHDFLELRDRNQRVAELLVEVLITEVHRLSEHLVEALYLPVEQRLVRRLLMLADSYADRGGTVILVTQDDLASLVGSARPTTNRVLKSLEADGVIKLGRGRIEVLDRIGLEHRAH